MSELVRIVEHFEEVELLRGKLLHLYDSLRRVMMVAYVYHNFRARFINQLRESRRNGAMANREPRGKDHGLAAHST
ncbi:hypothetical protein SB748_28400 [Rhizobium sp. SIMBA_035]